MISDIYKTDAKVSNYQPPKVVRDLISNVVKPDYEKGDEILNTPYVELNNLSPLDRNDRDQRTFNAFVDENIEDPAEAWKWRGTRSKARNKAIALHSHITSGYVIPQFMAQNENDEEDVTFSDLMRDGVEWMVNNSEYKNSYVSVAMGMLVNTVTYMGAEYSDVFQKIKEKQEDGSYTKKEILDETLSGFKAPLYTTDQILITNAFQPNIQRQRCLIKRRWIEYSEAEGKYGKHENWDYVMPGTNITFNEEDGLFYDVKDDDHSTLVEECIYLNRKEDIEVPFVGGVYMGDSDIEANPIKHRDNRNAPKYNITPFGYQRVNEHFYFYKSMMNANYWDNQLLDAQYEMTMNRGFLDLYPPIAITGQDEFDEDVVFPGAQHSFKDKETKVVPILPTANLSAMFASIGKVEASMEEGTISDLSAGQAPSVGQTATAIAIANANAKQMLQGVGRTLAMSMVQFGGLMADIFITHLTVPLIDELSGDSDKLRYRTFVLPKKMVKGKEVSKVMKFDDSLLGAEMTDEQKTSKEMKMLEEIGYPDHKKHLYLINPEVFARFKYLAYCEPQTMFPKNQDTLKAEMEDLYRTLRQDPFVSAEGLVKDLLHTHNKDDLLQKQQVGGIIDATGGMKGQKATNIAEDVIKKAAVPSLGQ